MDTKQILITGGTGFIGNYLRFELLKSGHFITIVSRSPEKYAEEQADNQKFVSWENGFKEAVEQADVIINLAGRNLFGRWNERVKKQIYNSRIESTRKIVEAIEKASSKPDLLISASGVSIYGDHGDEKIDEKTPPADHFLGKLCVDWENEAKRAEKSGVRVANPRIAPVFEGDGGMLKKMKLPFWLGIGGPVGSGSQYVPWIHMQDLCSAILYPIQNENLSGAFNASSPNPETMNRFAKTLGKVMNRPTFFKVPEFALKIVLGEGSKLALESLRVQPTVLIQAGFNFEFTDLEEALADVI